MTSLHSHSSHRFETQAGTYHSTETIGILLQFCYCFHIMLAPTGQNSRTKQHFSKLCHLVKAGSKQNLRKYPYSSDAGHRQPLRDRNQELDIQRSAGQITLRKSAIITILEW